MIMVLGMMLIINNSHVNVDRRIVLDTLFEKAPDGELIKNLKKIILELINNFSQKQTMSRCGWGTITPLFLI